MLSETDLIVLTDQQAEEPSFRVTSPDHREEPAPDAAGRPVDLSGESDGEPSLPDGGGLNEQSGKYSEIITGT